MSPLLFFLTIHGVNALQYGMKIAEDGFNFVVSIRHRNEHSCSGAIIDETHILTAGHCVYIIPPSALSVVTGTVEIEDRHIQLLQVKNIYTHPDFEATDLLNSERTHWKNNIAVLKLEEELVWDPTIAPTPLIHEEYDWDLCNLCQFLGWDVTATNEFRVGRLLWSNAAVMTDERCRTLNMHLSENEKCVGDPFRASIVEEGDSGAPFISNNLAVGILVGGGRTIGNPAIVLVVHPYLEFIAHVVHNDEINVPLEEFQYYVSIWHLGRYRCGGSILTATHILTAGHCVYGIRRTDLRVVAGRSEFSESDRTIDWLLVNNIRIHPDYEEHVDSETKFKSIKNDIAILTLDSSFVWSTTISPIPLANDLPNEEPCRVYRWSSMYSKQKSVSLKSMWSSAMILSAERYQRMGINLESNQFYINSLYSLPIAGPGDSGSPIICDGVAVGFLAGLPGVRSPSWGSSYPIVFINIFSYSEFIIDSAPGAFF